MTRQRPLLAAEALCGAVVQVDIDQRPTDFRSELEPGRDVIFAVTTTAADGSRRFVALVTPCQLVQQPQRIFADLVGPPETPIAADTPLDVVAALLEQRPGRAVAVAGDDGRISAVSQASLQRALLARERHLLAEAHADARRLTVWSERLEGLHGAARQLLQLLGEHLLERETLQQAIEVLARLLDARYGALGLIDRQQQLTLFVHTGLSAAEIAQIGTPPTGKGLLGVVVRQDEALRLDDLAADPRAGGFPPGHPPMRHLLAVPISHCGDVFGRIYLCDKRTGEAFTEDDERLTRCLADSVSAMLVSARALDQQRQAELQLRQSQKLAAIGRLAGGIAHDFNNLLTVMACGAELIAERAGAEIAIHASALDIRDATARAAELTGQLLAFGRKGARAQPRLVEFNGVVADLARLLRRVLGDQYALTLELDPEVPAIRADVSELNQIVMNLIINARDAMTDGGTIRVVTRARPGGCGALELEVSDTGAGIDAEILPHIFDPYFTTKATGTGIGLTTTDAIVRGLGGTIAVASSPGQGSTFTVTLPTIADAARTEARRGPDLSIAVGRGERIAVVEDSVAVGRMLVDVLTRAGYHVEAFGHGREALAALAGRGAGLELLVSDVDMPELGGVDLAAALRAKAPALRVLFLSGAATVAVGPRDALLCKPFTPQALTHEVRAILDR